MVWRRGICCHWMAVICLCSCHLSSAQYVVVDPSTSSLLSAAASSPLVAAKAIDGYGMDVVVAAPSTIFIHGPLSLLDFSGDSSLIESRGQVLRLGGDHVHLAAPRVVCHSNASAMLTAAPLFYRELGNLHIAAKQGVRLAGIVVVHNYSVIEGCEALSAATGHWVAGGDSGQSWSGLASSRYRFCSSYNLCNEVNAFDGTTFPNGTAVTSGAAFAFDGYYNPFPHTLEIDFRRAVKIKQWRFWPSGHCSYNAKRVSLLVKTGTTTTSIPGSTIMVGQENRAFESKVFDAPVTSKVQVNVESVYDCTTNPSSMFQVYIRDVSFRVVE